MQLDIAFKVETFASLTSTQDVMRTRLEQGEAVHGLVIRALQQTAGRGQRRRDWWSGPGGSYQTLAIKDHEPPILNKPYAALAIALGLAEVLGKYGIQVGIKWPNDLYYKNKKVAGILCEYVRGHLLAAVGMNVNNEVPEGATALRGLDVEGVSKMVLAGMQRGLEYLIANLNLIAGFANYDVLENQEIEVEMVGEVYRGIARGINAQGCLRLAQNGQIKLVCHGQVRGKVKRV